MPPLRLSEIGKDGTRQVSAALRKAPSGMKGGKNRAGLGTAGDRCHKTDLYTDLPVTQSRAGRQTGRGRPARDPRGRPRPSPPPPRGGRTRRGTRAHTHARTRTHLLDVLPDGGAVVADDEQLQGVIDEAVLRGRARRRHGQAPGGGAPSAAPQHPSPPHPTPPRCRSARREAISPKQPTASPSPPKTKGRGPALLTAPSSQAHAASSLPPRAPAPSPARPDRTGRPPSAPVSRVGKVAGRSSPWCRGAAVTPPPRSRRSVPIASPPPPSRHRPDSQWRARPLL